MVKDDVEGEASELRLVQESTLQWATTRAVKDGLNDLIGSSLFTNANGFGELYRRFLALNHTRQTWLSQQLEQLRLPPTVEHNRLVTQTERDQVIKRITAILEQAEHLP